MTLTPTHRPPQVSASPPSGQPSVTSNSTRRIRPGRSPVQQVGENLREVIGDEQRDYDVFISHASADKGDAAVDLMVAWLQHSASLRLRDEAATQGITVGELARRLGWDPETFRRRLRGEQRITLEDMLSWVRLESRFEDD